MKLMREKLNSLKLKISFWHYKNQKKTEISGILQTLFDIVLESKVI